jgi:hypothetical protein
MRLAAAATLGVAPFVSVVASANPVELACRVVACGEAPDGATPAPLLDEAFVMLGWQGRRGPETAGFLVPYVTLVPPGVRAPVVGRLARSQRSGD